MIRTTMTNDPAPRSGDNPRGVDRAHDRASRTHGDTVGWKNPEVGLDSGSWKVHSGDPARRWTDRPQRILRPVLQGENHMKVRYFSDTDTALIEFVDHDVAATKKIGENIYVDLDTQGNLVSTETTRSRLRSSRV